MAKLYNSVQCTVYTVLNNFYFFHSSSADKEKSVKKGKRSRQMARDGQTDRERNSGINKQNDGQGRSELWNPLSFTHQQFSKNIGLQGIIPQDRC